MSIRAWIDGEEQPKAGLNFHTSKITLHGNSGTAQAGAESAEIPKAETAAKEEVPNDDLPF